MNKLLVIGFLSLALIGCGGEPSHTENQTETTKEPTEYLKDSLKLGVTFDITPNQFGERVDATLEKLDIESGDWSKVSNKGEYFDTIVKDYPNKITLTATVDKNGKLRSVQYMLATAEAKGEAALTYSMLAFSAVKAIDPNMDSAKAQDISVGALERTSTKFVETKEHQREVHTVGKNTYVTEMSPVAITFRADPTEASDYVE